MKYFCKNKDCKDFNKEVEIIKILTNKKDSYGNFINKKICISCKGNAELKELIPLQMNRNIRYFHGAKNGLKGSVY